MGGIYRTLFLLLLFVQPYILPAGLYSNVQNGVLDLRGVGFDKSNIYSLGGNWEFYWNKLIDPERFQDTIMPLPDLLGEVPSYWTDYSLNGRSLPGKGYGTYRLVILLPQGFSEKLVLNVPVFDSSFKLYINGKLAGENGIVGKSYETSKPGYKPFLLEIAPVKDTLELLVQVSNFQHRRGGFWKKLKIGLYEPIVREHSLYTFFSYSSMGILLAFSLFFLFFFFFYRKDKVPLLFSLFLAGIFIRLICTGIYPITLISDISWDWMVKWEYLGMYAASIAGIWFLHSLYPLKFMKPVHYSNSAIVFVFCLVILFTRVDYFAYTMIYFQFLVIFYLLFYLIYGFVTIFTKGPINLVYFISTFLLLLAIMNDVVLANSRGSITRDYTIHIAAQIFVFIHAIMLIRIWIKAFIEKGRLVNEIEYLNTNLEKIISQRTLELQEKNVEVINQNEKIAIQNIQLKDEIDFKNRVFSIIAHDLKSPIGSLLLFFDVLKKNISENAKEAALNSIHNLALSVNNLIDNLLYWGRSQDKQVPVSKSNVDLDKIILNVIELFYEPSKQKSIEISYQKTFDSIAFCDPELMQIIARNLISNAIKFTHEGGKIEVLTGPFADDNSQVIFSVSDNGIGIPESKLNLLQSGEKIDSTYGTLREKGTGLGLTLCMDLVSLQDGRMEILSQTDKGTIVNIYLPTSQ